MGLVDAGPQDYNYEKKLRVMKPRNPPVCNVSAKVPIFSFRWIGWRSAFGVDANEQLFRREPTVAESLLITVEGKLLYVF